jgi:hypothetical protein
MKRLLSYLVFATGPLSRRPRRVRLRAGRSAPDEWWESTVGLSSAGSRILRLPHDE